MICEASSFQLEDADAFAPECGVLLNLAPDHLDRHRDLDRLPRREAAACSPTRPRATSRSTTAPTPGSPGSRSAARGRRSTSRPGSASSTSRCPAPTTPPTPPRPPSPRRRSGSATTRSPPGCASFPGVPHRLERVAEIDGVLYVNDSKATNVAAAAAALRSFDGGVRAILGGSLKGEQLRRARRAGRRALRRLLPDRRGGGADRARPRARLGGRGRAPPLRRPRRGRGGRGRRGRRPARSSCSPRPAPASTPTATSRSAASTSGPWSGSSRDEPGEEGRAADRVLAAADRDALPARLRRRHGLQRQLDHVAARRVRRQRLLPEADADLRRDRARASCTCSPAAG